ncbi:hypothetical protein DNTS_014789, partial [Danionella cerebrum]
MLQNNHGLRHFLSLRTHTDEDCNGCVFVVSWFTVKFNFFKLSEGQSIEYRKQFIKNDNDVNVLSHIKIIINCLHIMPFWCMWDLTFYLHLTFYLKEVFAKK